MKQFLIFFLAISLFGCKNEPRIDYALFSGTVKNSNADTLTIKGSDFDQDISINADGTFSDTLKIAQPGYFTLNIGRERSPIYLRNGYHLNMTIDTNEFDETIKYSGVGADENNYLASKSLYNQTVKANPEAFYGLEENEFKTELENVRKNHSKTLDALDKADKDFVAIERKNLQYDMYAELNGYASAHAYYSKNPDFKISDNFLPSELKDMKFDDAEAYSNSSSYKQLAYENALNKIFDPLGDDYNNASSEDLKSISDLKIMALKEDVVAYLGKFMVSPSNPNMKNVHEFLVNNTSVEETKRSLNITYEKNKNLVKGMPSPEFVNYENHKGGVTSLDDLKGKYVYIDVWATWCGPCKREIPYLKEVEKKYHDKNIEFVSTSIDVAKDHSTWVEMVKNEQLGGMQLMADNNWKSKFVVDYGIEGIPRFILVDPNGNIVSADAPRPSDPKLVELLEALKI